MENENLKTEDKITLIVFSGDLDKLLAALNIAVGSTTLQKQVSLFFTFWGLNALRKTGKASKAKHILQKIFKLINKGGSNNLPLSKFHFAGGGTWAMKQVMKAVNMQSVEEMLKLAKSLGVKFIACSMTMDALGIAQEDMREDLIDEYAGVVTYLTEAEKSNINLFI